MRKLRCSHHQHAGPGVSSRVLHVNPGLQELSYMSERQHSISIVPGERSQEHSERTDIRYATAWVIPILAGCVLAGLLLAVYYYISAALDKENPRVEGPGKDYSGTTEKSRAILACYYDPESAHRMNWAYDLNTDFKHRNCTHVIYQGLMYTHGKVHAEDEAHAKAYIPRFVALKRRGLTVMASLSFEDLAKVVAQADTFTSNLLTWIASTGFQGIDIDVDWDENATLYNKVVELAGRAVRDKQLILSTNVYFTPNFITAVDIDGLYASSDFLVLNTYNLTSDPQRTSAPAALYGRMSWHETLGSVYKKTRSMARLVPTISFMSREFELVEPFTSGAVRAGLPASDYGPPGVYTNRRGLLAYYEACDALLDPAWVTQWQKTEYCYMRVKQKRFLVFEDESSVSCKMRYLTQHQFAGVALKHMDLDVFRNKCDRINPLFLTILDISIDYAVSTEAIIQWPSLDPVPRAVMKPNGKVECIREAAR